VLVDGSGMYVVHKVLDVAVKWMGERIRREVREGRNPTPRRVVLYGPSGEVVQIVDVETDAQASTDDPR
jgi:hypothetical protein